MNFLNQKCVVCENYLSYSKYGMYICKHCNSNFEYCENIYYHTFDSFKELIFDTLYKDYHLNIKIFKKHKCNKVYVHIKFQDIKYKFDMVKIVYSIDIEDLQDFKELKEAYIFACKKIDSYISNLIFI
jgi:hypothetical protein